MDGYLSIPSNAIVQSPDSVIVVSIIVIRVSRSTVGDREYGDK